MSHPDPSSRKLLSPWLSGAVSPFRDCPAAKSHPSPNVMTLPWQAHPMTPHRGGLKVSQLHPTEDNPPGTIPAQVLPVGAVTGSASQFPSPSALCLPRLPSTGIDPKASP